MLSIVISAYGGDFVRGSSNVKCIGVTNRLGIRLTDGKQNKIQSAQTCEIGLYIIVSSDVIIFRLYLLFTGLDKRLFLVRLIWRPISP